MKIQSGYILIAVWLLLGGCASVDTQPVTTVPSVPTDAGLTAAPADAPVEQPPAADIAASEPRPPMSGNRAVVALLDKAGLDSKAGKGEAAGASLERALRIEPRNPWLWHELAQVRLSQGQYAQAITLAKKSNSFGGRQPRLQAENWQVIGKARVAQGDTAGAEQAFKLAGELAQQASVTNLK